MTIFLLRDVLQPSSSQSKQHVSMMYWSLRKHSKSSSPNCSTFSAKIVLKRRALAIAIQMRKNRCRASASREGALFMELCAWQGEVMRCRSVVPISHSFPECTRQGKKRLQPELGITPSNYDVGQTQPSSRSISARCRSTTACAMSLKMQAGPFLRIFSSSTHLLSHSIAHLQLKSKAIC